MKRDKLRNSSLNVLIFCLLFLLSGNVSADRNLILGVHPFLSHDEVINKFTPLANYLSVKTGMNIQLKVGSTYEDHIDYIGLNHVDIAYLGPASYVNMTNKYGLKPILSRLEVKGQSYFQGNIVVHKNSEIKDIADLRGRNIAFGDPNSTMSYIVPHYMLHSSGIFDNNTTKHQFLNSHTNVALGVLTGDFDAGAVKPAVFKKFEKDGLRVLAVTPKISEHLFVASSDLEKEKIKKIRKAMLGIKDSQEGLAALQVIKKSITGLSAASNEDYDNLRHIINDSMNLH